ncbi:type II toxin-antitoxin system VapC family toxin [Dyadobacter sediminis]|uniref:Type II toxin-antitoxin system VapC family toxin n=1 Tax=Dyadobacter sediminis TaxID=1493691 RepID=A0A5R9K8H4_9BACT|nr:PIN domain-containing protein [Dyadobacter sediminis]TLU90362.1 type II toxin-antitoxin system VapC family toxin [Dyadobacter sediminis]GGC07172.1 hypothetical protein GCM10011325_37550 [Dyadobacter sediminis]
MIYFDTDVIIHYFIKQDLNKHNLAIKLFREAFQSNQFFCSLLCLQEASFVFSKLNMPNSDIDVMTNKLLISSPVTFDVGQFKRAKVLANEIGFHNINDCLHLAIAEVHCNQLYTFNKSDFNRLKRLTKLELVIL